uniref:Helicase n=1 Tax=Tetraselmis sp. GSL018 TaxID=582737 RepID=A0A061R109_9CHLO|mmetsp:Transcript_430/g.910  ORF Transcript_430/g.910 Transcript_430/m.910 type:complete len:965 (-) Transcript_430:185-3079(-)
MEWGQAWRHGAVYQGNVDFNGLDSTAAATGVTCSAREMQPNNGYGANAAEGVASHMKDEDTESEATVSEGSDTWRSGAVGDVHSARQDEGVDYLQQQFSELLQRLEAYRSVHGDCNVPREFPEDPKLGAWVHEQRQRQRRGNLPRDRYEALSALGFNWESPSEAAWRESYVRLSLYKERHGDCLVPGNYAADTSLAMWVKYQREAKKRGRLSPMQIQLLEQLGFQWEQAQHKQWSDKFEKLKVYKQTYGDCNVPYSFAEDPALGMWVKYQRDARRRGRLNRQHQELLDSIGFQWEPVLNKQWAEHFEKLAAFQREHGHADVSPNHEDQSLAMWVEMQRDAYRQGKLSQDRARSMKEIGFRFDGGRWRQMFERLAVYSSRHGSCNVPEGYPDDPYLGPWVVEQRGLARNGNLTQEFRGMLDGIGFDWSGETAASSAPSGHKRARAEQEPSHVSGRAEHGSASIGQAGRQGDNAFADGTGSPPESFTSPRQSKASGDYEEYLNQQWLKQLDKLKQYKERFGNCEVPRDYPADPTLSSWVNEQRDRCRKGQLLEDRMAKLSELGFQWKTQAELVWDDQFERLQAYSKKYGDCNVPQNFSEDPKLANWVIYQKERIRKGKMPTDRLEKLRSIGFEWEPLAERQWNENFERLVSFREKHGHCSVPANYTEDPHLAVWAQTQRERKHERRLSAAHQQRLEGIDFDWGEAPEARPSGSEPGPVPRADAASAAPERAPGRMKPPQAPAPKTVQAAEPASLHSEDSLTTNSESAGSQARPARGVSQADSEQVSCVISSMNRTAEMLSSYAAELSQGRAKRRKLRDKLKMAQTLQLATEQQYKTTSAALAKHEDTIRNLKLNMDVMTGALSKAKQDAAEMERRAAAAEAELSRMRQPSANGATAEAPVEQEPLPGYEAASCVLCRTRPRACVVIPCMHLLCCRQCLEQRQRETGRVCPGCGTECASVLDVRLGL